MSMEEVHVVAFAAAAADVIVIIDAAAVRIVIDVAVVLAEVVDREKIEEEHRLELLKQQRLPFRGLHIDGFHCSWQKEGTYQSSNGK